MSTNLPLNKEPMTDAKKIAQRPFHGLKFGAQQLFSMFLVPFFNLILLLTLNYITLAWGMIMHFFLVKLGLNSELLAANNNVFHLYNFTVYYPQIEGTMPSYFQWWSGLLATVVCFYLSYALPENFTAFAFFIRIVLLIQLSSQMYFLISPNAFPYYLSDYIKNGFLQTLVLLFLTPWILAFTYYIFDIEFYKKIIITGGLIAHIIIFTPLLYTLHLFIINQFSLLYMPILYLIFGILPNIFIIIVFFSLGLGWKKTC